MHGLCLFVALAWTTMAADHGAIAHYGPMHEGVVDNELGELWRVTVEVVRRRKVGQGDASSKIIGRPGKRRSVRVCE